jgi:hypothetical protein
MAKMTQKQKQKKIKKFHGSGSAIRKNAAFGFALNQCGSETLHLSMYLTV